jgi:hypothetical protein
MTGGRQAAMHYLATDPPASERAGRVPALADGQSGRFSYQFAIDLRRAPVALSVSAQSNGVFEAHRTDNTARSPSAPTVAEPLIGSTLIPLTFNEIRHLFAQLITNAIHTIDHCLHWSTWRRRH